MLEIVVVVPVAAIFCVSITADGLYDELCKVHSSVGPDHAWNQLSIH